MNKDEQIEETLSPEELAELMREYKKDLARIYRTASARRVQILRDEAGAEGKLRSNEASMRAEIEALKRKYGIRY